MGGGGQRPFGTFPKIHPFWKGQASLTLNDVSGVGVETTTDSSSNETTADSSSTGAATWASSNETNTGASSPGAHS